MKVNKMQGKFSILRNKKRHKKVFGLLLHSHIYSDYKYPTIMRKKRRSRRGR